MVEWFWIRLVASFIKRENFRVNYESWFWSSIVSHTRDFYRQNRGHPDNGAGTSGRFEVLADYGDAPHLKAGFLMRHGYPHRPIMIQVAGEGVESTR